MLLEQLCCQLGGGVLVRAFQHAALALLRRREGLEDVGRRTLQADGVYLDQRIILQGVVVKYVNRLLVAVEDAADGHVAGLVELLMQVSRQGVWVSMVM